MTDTILNPTAAASRVHALFGRLQMLQELTRLTLANLPNSTDCDVPVALLNGMQEILSTDAAVAYRLGEAVAKMAASADHLQPVVGVAA